MHKDANFWLDNGNNILSALFPTDFGQIICEYRNGVLGSEYIYFLVSPCDLTINNVSTQYPDFVGLSLELNTMELSVANVMGKTGRTIAVKGQNKFTSYDNIVIPFRKVKPETDKIIKAIKAFFTKYIELTKLHRETLYYSNFYTEAARKFFDMPLFEIKVSRDNKSIIVTGGKEFLTCLSIIYAQSISTMYDNSIAMILPIALNDMTKDICEFFYTV
jgi:hypothetical protein